MSRPNLTTTERNLLNYMETHYKRTPTAPCFVPGRYAGGTLDRYLKILERLEERNLIKVERNDGPYTTWVLKKISHWN